MRNTAVLVNEFGEVGLDHHLLRRVNERTVLLGGGCVCCAMRGDLVESLVDLLGESPRLDKIFIETSGLADPAPILFTVFSDPVLQHRFEAEAVIATVDAVNGNLHLDNHPESIKQIAAADEISITKTDIAAPEDAHRLLARLRAINPSAEISGPSPNGEAAPQGDPRKASRTQSTTEEHHGSDGVETISVTFDGAVEWAAFGAWLSMLLHARGEDVLRVKGLLDVGENGPVVLDGVQHIIHPPRHLDEWPDDDTRTRIVFIAKGVGANEILASLGAFSGLLGAKPQPLLSGSESTSSQLMSRPG